VTGEGKDKWWRKGEKRGCFLFCGKGRKGERGVHVTINIEKKIGRGKKKKREELYLILRLREERKGLSHINLSV